MVNLQPMPAFPTDFSNTQGATDYAINIGVIFGGFIIAAMILSIVMIVMCCCFCCKKPKEGSQQYMKLVHIGISVAIVVVAVVACGVGWGYNNTCNNGVKRMSGSVGTLLTGAGGILTSVDASVNKIADNLVVQVQNTTNQLSSPTLMSPIDNILNHVDSAQETTADFTVLTQGMVDNTTAIKTDFEFLSNSSADLTGVPQTNDIPHLDDSFVDSMHSANQSVENIRDNVLSIKRQVNNTLNNIKSGQLDEMNKKTGEYSNDVRSLSKNFDSIRSQLTSINGDYDKTYKNQINSYSDTRTSVVTAVLVLPIAITLVAVVGVILKKVIILKIVATLSFIFFFWYMLIAGVNYTLYTVTHGFCIAQDTIVGNLLGSLKENTTVGNRTYMMSDKVKELLQCSGNKSLITVFEADFLINDLLTTVTAQADDMLKEAGNLNFSSDFEQAGKDLDSFKENTVNLDFEQNKNVTEVEEKLNNNIDELEALLPPAQANFSAQLAKVNDITENAEYSNGTTVSVTYTESTISELDCNDSTWATITDHNELCSEQTVAQASYETLTDFKTTLSHAQDASEKVSYYPNDFVEVNNNKNKLVDDIDSIQNGIGNGFNGINVFVNLVKGVVASLKNFLRGAADSLIQATGCSFIGDAYGGFTDGFCKELSPSLQVIGAMMVLGAASLFGTAVHSCVAIYKITGSDDDDEEFESAYSYDPEKGKKNVSLNVRSSND